MHEVLVNRLGGLSLPRKSVVRLTDRPDMTLDVYRGRKNTTQQYLIHVCVAYIPPLQGHYFKILRSRKIHWVKLTITRHQSFSSISV